MIEIKYERSDSLRRQLLIGVSMTALLVWGVNAAEAADGDRPSVWIELGGQLDHLSNTQETFAPHFLDVVAQPDLRTALDVQHSPAFAIGAEGKLTFEPVGSDWSFSVGVRYGRSEATRHRHHQTPNAMVPVHFTVFGKYKGGYSMYPSGHVNLASGTSSIKDRYGLLDFEAGKDVGLGMFGSRGSSRVNVGVRVAQFTSKSDITLRAVPDVRYSTAPISSFAGKYAFEHPNPIMHFHAYTGMSDLSRSFQGMGPSLTWNASASIAGDSDEGLLSLEWGANAAVLFGRQKVRGQIHNTTFEYTTGGHWVSHGGPNPAVHNGVFYNTAAYGGGNAVHLRPQRSATVENIDRKRAVTVPNFGGFAGVSYRMEDFKVKLGYRADMFLNAMDTGNDTRRTTNMLFHGPFATISIGLGG